MFFQGFTKGSTDKTDRSGFVSFVSAQLREYGIFFRGDHMKWINALENIKSPDPKPIGTDDANAFLWGVKNHTDKTDKISTREKRENERTGYPIPMDETEFAMEERQAIIGADGGQDKPYSGPMDLKSRDLSEDELLAVHRVREFFQGTLVP
jgi:hypothetical protein